MLGGPMKQKFTPFWRRTKNEPVTIRAARISGKYTIASALAGALVAAVLGFILSNSSAPSASPAPSAATPTVSAAPDASGGPTVAVRQLSGLLGDGTGSWIVTKPLDQLTPLPDDEAGVEQWVAANNAIDAQTSDGSAVTNLQVTIQGRSGTQIILTGINFVVVRRQTGIIQGGLVQNTGAGPMMFRYMDVDLDDKPPKITGSLPDQMPLPSDPPSQSMPIRFPYFVSESSSETFDIIAHTRSDVVWYAELLWSVDGRNGQTIINNDGRDFKTAMASLAAAKYAYSGGRWQVCAEGNTSCGQLRRSLKR